MKKVHNGFTIIEVTLFLAITGLLFLGVTFGVQSSVFRQRFNDSVQNFSEFLRNIYAETMNVQNADSGRSKQAIFGKLVTFGEEYNFIGDKVNGEEAFVYDVVGDATSDVGGGGGGILEALSHANADVIIKEEGKVARLAGIVESYKPKWSARIQPACNAAECLKPIKATLLIVRHPRSGTVYTYVMKNSAIPVNAKMKTPATVNNILKSYLTDANFKPDPIDFCVNPMGEVQYGSRADVRIKGNSRNSSGIEIFNDVNDNNCK